MIKATYMIQKVQSKIIYVPPFLTECLIDQFLLNMNKNCVLFQNSDILDKDKIETYQETITRYYIFSGWNPQIFAIIF